jgi:hypothetical protein
VDDQLNPHVVCVAEQALVQSSKRGIRSGLDDPIHTDGRRIVHHMAVAAKSHAGYMDRPFCSTAFSQHHLEFAFFGLQNTLFGVLTIVPLWILIAVTIYQFYKVDKWASYLLLPYLAWVSIATAPNASVYLLNG